MSEKVLIDRKLLADLLSQDRETRINAERSLYAQLANTTLPQPAAVEAVEVVAWLDEGPEQPDCTASRRVMMDWANCGYTIQPLMTVAQHERIMAAIVPAGYKVVPVELLERAAYQLELGDMDGPTLRELRALLEVKP